MTGNRVFGLRGCRLFEVACSQGASVRLSWSSVAPAVSQQRQQIAFLLGGFDLLLPRGWVMECSGVQHVLCGMMIVHPNQAGSLQGLHGVSRVILAANDPESGSGWQQSKQNWALPAVVGK